jgi:signal peptidase complex subunit 2
LARGAYEQMVISAVSCVLAGYAYMYPLKYPDNRHVLLFCCGLFWLFNIVLYLISLLEGARIVETKTTKTCPTKLIVSSALPLHSDQYSFEVMATNKNNNSSTAESTHSITKWFSEDGSFFDEDFAAEVRRTIEKVESGANKKQQ